MQKPSSLPCSMLFLDWGKHTLAKTLSCSHTRTNLGFSPFQTPQSKGPLQTEQQPGDSTLSGHQYLLLHPRECGLALLSTHDAQKHHQSPSALLVCTVQSAGKLCGPLWAPTSKGRGERWCCSFRCPRPCSSARHSPGVLWKAAPLSSEARGSHFSPAAWNRPQEASLERGTPSASSRPSSPYDRAVLAQTCRGLRHLQSNLVLSDRLKSPRTLYHHNQEPCSL